VNRRARQNKAPNVLARMNRPSQLKSNIQVHHKFRFLASSSFIGSINTQTMMGIAGVMASSTTNAYVIASTMKINSIEAWTPPASQGSAATVSLIWAGYNNAPEREVSDTTVSVSTPAYIKSSPPTDSLAKFWFNQVSNQNIFVLNAPVGTIVDVDVDFILFDDAEVQTAVVLIGATAGLMYYSPLDGFGAASKLNPVSLISIA
jgi:hypothetical protein